MSSNLEHQVRLLNDIIHDCARYMQRDFGEMVQLQSSKKGVQDFTRKCYSRLQTRMTNSLMENRPKYGISLANESFPTDSEYFFVLDPIVGLMNFQRSIPFCCTSIAIFKQNPNDLKNPEALAIAIHNPIMRETFYAAKSCGAWFENYNESIIPKSRMRTSSQNILNQALVSTSIASKNFVNSRDLGCNLLEMAYLAAGRLDIIINKNENLLTKAAFMLIREAGGYVAEKTDIFLASNEPINKHATEVFNSL